MGGKKKKRRVRGRGRRAVGWEACMRRQSRCRGGRRAAVSGPAPALRRPSASPAPTAPFYRTHVVHHARLAAALDKLAVVGQQEVPERACGAASGDQRAGSRRMVSMRAGAQQRQGSPRGCCGVAAAARAGGQLPDRRAAAAWQSKERQGPEQQGRAHRRCRPGRGRCGWHCRPGRRGCAPWSLRTSGKRWEGCGQVGRCTSARRGGQGGRLLAGGRRRARRPLRLTLLCTPPPAAACSPRPAHPQPARPPQHSLHASMRSSLEAKSSR